MERRDFLKQTGKAVALAAVTGGTGLIFHNRDVLSRPAGVSGTIPSFTVTADTRYPAVALCRHEDPISALNRSLDAIGGIKRFVKSGERVTIKPNVGWDRSPAQAANTNPALVGEMVRLCLAAGAVQVVVTDVSCNDPRRCFLRSGVRAAAEEAGASVLLPLDEDYRTVDLNGKLLSEWPVLRHFIETDRLINMPIVKQHSLSRCTIGMKNLYGILGGRRNQLHQQIDQSIVDLTAFANPTLTVVDATHVLTQGGPQGGSLDYVVREDTVICGTDPVAVDARSCEYLGLQGHAVSHITLAGAAGLGLVDYKAAGCKEIVG
ncbi:MAG: DUF362 domain-containing protein [candidate division Zixibacteria bacterium]|nr:DUF362 domain-containing protein [candidate division Zixibacteria bacterium]